VDGMDAQPFYGAYHQTVASFIQGSVAPQAFNLDDGGDLPTEILTNNQTLFYCSVGELHPTAKSNRSFLEKLERKLLRLKSDENQQVFKVFTPEPLSNAQTNFLFRSVIAEKSISWFAYPQYSQRHRLPNPLKFELAPNVFSVNMIEWAASAM